MAAAETMPAYSRGSILGVLMHLAGAARTSAMGVAGIGVHLWWRLWLDVHWIWCPLETFTAGWQ